MAKRMTKKHREMLREIVGAYPLKTITKQTEKMAAAKATNSGRPAHFEGNPMNVWLCVETERVINPSGKSLSILTICNRMSRRMRDRKPPHQISAARLRGLYYQFAKKMRGNPGLVEAVQIMLPVTRELAERDLAAARANGRPYKGLAPILIDEAPEWLEKRSIPMLPVVDES